MSNLLSEPTPLDWAGDDIAAAPADVIPEPGTKGRWRVPVARRASGEDLAIHVHAIRGLREGPTLALVASVHGDAIYGSRIVMDALSRLDPAMISGTVLAVPVVNPLAFESATRNTGQGMNTDMTNMNRVFPGDPGGWVNQKMAAAVSQFVLDQADAVIDYHCGGDTSINYTLVNGATTAWQRRVYDFTRLMATEFVFIHDSDPFSGTIDGYVKSQGKLCVIAEQGGNIMPDGFLELSAQRIENFLAGLGMLKTEPVLPERQLVMRERTQIRMDHGGIFLPSLGIEGLATLVEGRTLLGTVVDPHSLEVLQKIYTPYEMSAILMMRPQMSRVNPGDYGYIIANGGSGEWIEAPADWAIEV